MQQLRALRPAAAGRTSRRWLGAIAAAAVTAGPVLSGGPAAVAAGPAAVTVGELRIDNRADQPLGVDDTTPTLSWKLAGSGAAARQTAYEVRVADAAGAPLWDSGRVDGAATGRPTPARRSPRARASRGRYGRGTATVTPRTGARRRRSRWACSSSRTGAPRSGSTSRRRRSNRGVTIDVGEQDARYVRLDVTKLGLPLYESSYGAVVAHPARGDAGARARRHQPRARQERLGVRPVPVPGLGHAAAHRRPDHQPRLHEPPVAHAGRSAPSKWVQVDLGSVQHFDRIVLYPRSDARTPDGQIPNFPVDFTLRDLVDVLRRRPTVIKTVTDQPNPPGPRPRATRCRSSRKPFTRDQAGQPRRACTSPASAPTRRRSTASRSPTPCSTPA